MSRKIHPFDVHAGPPRDFHIHQRQRDGNAGAPIQHFVQERVARILIRDAVADEMQLAEEIFVERHHTRVIVRIDARRRIAWSRRVDAQPGLTADRIDAIEIRTRIETRVFDARNHQRGNGEIRIGAERGEGETANQLLFDHRVMRRSQDSATCTNGAAMLHTAVRGLRYPNRRATK